MSDGSVTEWWRVSVAEAMELQRRLAQQVCQELRVPVPITIVAGIDAAYGGGNIYGAAVALWMPSLEVIESAVAVRPEEFPYVPGLLSFREAPAILMALRSLHVRPDILLCDGQGIAHPRRLGIASHIGVLANIPTVGCAKSLLCGTTEEPPNAFGATAPVWDQEELVAMAVRTRRNAKPVYVSVGHRVDLPFAVDLVLRCCRGSRLPEPVRLADSLSKHAARSATMDGVTPSPATDKTP
ncbi:MAG: deoxyribonuclease V [Candidatus Kapabacteria bacterium]|nr:deoxyribonuclease V [Candidatus Kapabacteria bacterium]MCS7169009.1 deoxyribonuclease V [Candidatus Kapabacteria bacterium]MDW7997264.1 deoxyribonuclease V [Bacteroidota bacterium]MDW8226086.1 deoxyribonuclease V [Bacteroidota bacterium]